jgi:hypothetical protein
MCVLVLASVFVFVFAFVFAFVFGGRDGDLGGPLKKDAPSSLVLGGDRVAAESTTYLYRFEGIY